MLLAALLEFAGWFKVNTIKYSEILKLCFFKSEQIAENA